MPPRKTPARAERGRGPVKAKAAHITLAERIAAAVADGTFFYSFEYSPARDPRPEDLHARVYRMYEDLRPLWVDITWGFGDVGLRSIEASRHIQKNLGLPVLMHLICTDMTRKDLDCALDAALMAGVRSILVLRGFTQAGYDRWQRCDEGCDHADELVSYIRRRHGTHFCLGVAGFPDTHPESRADPRQPATADERAEDVRRLKGKVDAGAEFIICQFCFDIAVWHSFLRRCRAAGIRCPILPGVQPLTEHASARLLANAWSVQIPRPIGDHLRELELAADAEGAREYGCKTVAALCDAILHDDGGSSGTGAELSEGYALHFFVYDAEHEVRALLERLEHHHGWRRGCKPPAHLSSGHAHRPSNTGVQGAVKMLSASTYS